MMEENEVDPRDANTFYQILVAASREQEVDAGHFIDGFMSMRCSAAGIDVQILRCQADHILKALEQNRKEMLQNRNDMLQNRSQMTMVKQCLERWDGQLPSQSGVLHLQRLLEEGFRELRESMPSVASAVDGANADSIKEKL